MEDGFTAPLTEKANILANDQVGPGLYLLEASAPSIAQSVRPGQFVHLQVPGMEAHILRRPFSVYHADPSMGTISILYQAVGFGTRHMASLGLGSTLDAIGPLGNGWNVPKGVEKALIVGGGVGAAPLYMLASGLVAKGVGVHVVLGAQTKDMLACKTRYEDLQAARVAVATDDGTCGAKGFCIPLVEEALAGTRFDYAALCGPEPMLRAAMPALLSSGIPVQVSLERRMACGIGACLSCVVDTRDGMKRACKDGPVFDASEVVWQ